MARTWLSKISEIVEGRRPSAVVVYGQPGIGKTSLGAAIPGGVFLCDPGERGIETLKGNNLVAADVSVLPTPKHWTDVMEILRELSSEDHSYKALVMDGMGGFERLCMDYVCKNEFEGDWSERGFNSYGRGIEATVLQWRKLLIALDKLRDRGMAVLMLAHVRKERHVDPEGPDYDRYVPALNPKVWGLTEQWVDAVLFAKFPVEVDRDSKAAGGDRRVLRTTWSASAQAKNRSKMPYELDMGRNGHEAWKNLSRALQPPKEGQK